MNLTTRTATPEDTAKMAALLEELFSIERDFTPEMEKQLSGLNMLISSGANSRVFVAEAADGVVGMVTGQLLISTAEGGKVVLVEDLIVEKQFRGTGVGAQLLKEVEVWAESVGATRLQLLADKDNGPAEKFYTNSGWVKTNLICLRKTGGQSNLCPGRSELQK
ncbi:MAG: GNAT family N-acetyltransferase [Deltaproteobacteria bacterium]|nr:MAG: GNAT family N-acetyltransferase [Deltaproteobacteria bacterium]